MNQKLLLKTSSFSIALALIASFAFIPFASAYGTANWQVGFAGTGVLAGSGQQFGFWGWCAFAGGTASSPGAPVASGTDADCKVDNYFLTNTGQRLQFQQSIQGTAWDEKTCTFPPCLTANDFFITAGTVTLSGPLVLLLEKSGPPPPVCTTTGTVVTCPIPFLESIGFYNPDTGIPAAAGHYNLNSLLPSFGLVGQFQVQVDQLS